MSRAGSEARRYCRVFVARRLRQASPGPHCAVESFGRAGKPRDLPDHQRRARRCLSHHRRAGQRQWRSEEHTSELQSLMRISYAVFCLKKKKKLTTKHDTNKIHNTENTYTQQQTTTRTNTTY